MRLSRIAAVAVVLFGLVAAGGDVAAQANCPKGKLRLLYEAGPLGYLAEQAGGAASDGTQRVLDITPETLHQRTPLYIGNKSLVERAQEFLAKG